METCWEWYVGPRQKTAFAISAHPLFPRWTRSWIKERIRMGNKAYYANRQPVNSSLISRNSKLQIYRTSVRPVVTCGSESRTLTMEEERTLAVFERKILRKIYGPVKENELWRTRRNDELEAIIKGENIVRFKKCQRIRWLGHVERM